ncbi:hypothetical protein RSAG8_09700, partial [Rhizoctonia solani AG-8 WAC10335]
AGDCFKHHPLSVSFHSPSPQLQAIPKPLPLLLDVSTCEEVNYVGECIPAISLNHFDISGEEQLAAYLMDEFTSNADFLV